MTHATKRPTENTTAEKGAAVKITKGHAKSPVVDTRVPINEEHRHYLICEAAYYRAERRGFTRDPAEDWAEAEAEIDRTHFGEPE